MFESCYGQKTRPHVADSLSPLPLLDLPNILFGETCFKSQYSLVDTLQFVDQSELFEVCPAFARNQAHP